MAEGAVAADQLRLFIERIERLEEEKKGIIGIEALTASLPASFPSEVRVLFRAVARTVGRSSDL